jgi:hypothetical protein
MASWSWLTYFSISTTLPHPLIMGPLPMFFSYLQIEQFPVNGNVCVEENESPISIFRQESMGINYLEVIIVDLQYS